ncbi:hypothetical protein tinsulaeT_29850 [Thalassotalea insulae]|uniref:Uncharacterized protein n=1 Tax=Thalassotalea insulae TaxID=2056778 RepID=A0ABQ6GYR7_9GAMM|nr:hypothetical protein [Thalassotalea insulae]GLX79645.1 hypothetical protein tinsulaeT_29850 [Thalassotalea insulae]
MTYDDSDALNDGDIDNELDADIDIDTVEQKDAKVRKRIDDLLERKRLRELLDDSDDW